MEDNYNKLNAFYAALDRYKLEQEQLDKEMQEQKLSFKTLSPEERYNVDFVYATITNSLVNILKTRELEVVELSQIFSLVYKIYSEYIKDELHL